MYNSKNIFLNIKWNPIKRSDVDFALKNFGHSKKEKITRRGARYNYALVVSQKKK